MRSNPKVELSGWLDLMKAFEVADNISTYNKLITSYSEKHRAYHTLVHIEACFRHLDSVADQAKNPHEIELALWFHDVIYKPFSATNEDDSAQMAIEFLLENDIPQDVITRIAALIMITKEHNPPQSNDGKLMLDIDLSILGTAEPIYAQFEKDVRKEYKLVPSFLFKKKRKEILENFLSRAKIYQTEYFADRLESQARVNLAWAVNEL